MKQFEAQTIDTAEVIRCVSVVWLRDDDALVQVAVVMMMIACDSWVW